MGNGTHKKKRSTTGTYSYRRLKVISCTKTIHSFITKTVKHIISLFLYSFVYADPINGPTLFIQLEKMY